jgi:glycosyltransferase involved in cell wall biosynthesis
MASDVSVLIPAYGDSPYLIDTLISISNNSVLPDEVLIIDDGLSDKALQDIHNFQGNFRPLVRKSDGKGLVDALNAGLNLAQFKFICRIDNDDLMLSKRIETQLKYFKENAKTVAVGSQCVYIDSNGNETGLSKYFVGDISTSPKFSTQCLIAHPSTMYLRSAALSINGYRSIFNWNGTDIAEDFDFWLRLSRLGEIIVVDEFLTKYRQHPKQLSSLNSIGQSLGTPFISAVNKGELHSQQCLYF